jgi:hypothetical protein
MELRFVAMNASLITPARPVPTLADSGVEFCLAATTSAEGAIWRFLS